MTPQEYVKLMTPIISPYIPASHRPLPKQFAFMGLSVKEAGYGGATGGGKSDALLMDALQGCHVPGYAALLFRKTYSDLALPGALMDRAHEWFGPTNARWVDRSKTWEFPTEGREKATITFGFMDTEKDMYRYQGSELNYVGYDEATQFSERQYTYLFSRLRFKVETLNYMAKRGIRLPLKVRSATNPGGPGHIWYKNRFIATKKEKCKVHPLYDGGTTPIKDCKVCEKLFDAVNRIFVPSGLMDNPHVDAASYLEMLKELDPITREQYINGNWDVTEGGGMFNRIWLIERPDGAKNLWSPGYVKNHRSEFVKVVRYWDLAGSKVSTINSDPDYTAGVLMGLMADGRYFILDVRRIRETPGEVEKFLLETAEEDYAEWGDVYMIRGEQEPGSAGKFVRHSLTQKLGKYDVRFTKSTGAKYLRARPVAAAMFNGHVHMVKGAYMNEYLDELDMFSEDAIGHDDMVDATSGAYKEIKMKTNMSVGSADDHDDDPVVPKSDDGEEVELTPEERQYASKEYQAAIARAQGTGFMGGM